MNVYYCTVQIITLSASANNLSKILEQAEEYAALIMEELDHDNLGYIDVSLIYLFPCFLTFYISYLSLTRSWAWFVVAQLGNATSLGPNPIFKPGNR